MELLILGKIILLLYCLLAWALAIQTLRYTINDTSVVPLGELSTCLLIAALAPVTMPVIIIYYSWKDRYGK